MQVYSITLGYVESSDMEDLLTAKAIELGYAELQAMQKEIKARLAEAPEDFMNLRELEEVEFMMSVMQDEDGFVKDDIPF